METVAREGRERRRSDNWYLIVDVWTLNYTVYIFIYLTNCIDCRTIINLYENKKKKKKILRVRFQFETFNSTFYIFRCKNLKINSRCRFPDFPKKLVPRVYFSKINF